MQLDQSELMQNATLEKSELIVRDQSMMINMESNQMEMDFDNDAKSPEESKQIDQSQADDMMFNSFERQKKETMAGLNAALMEAQK